MSNPQSVTPPAPPRWLPWTWLILLWAVIFALAVSGYPNLIDNERRVGGYIMDVLQNGHWVIQQDVSGDIASKPPLLTWIASASATCFGRINRFSIYLPSALGTLGAALLVFVVGRKNFGWRAGFLGAFAYLLSYVSDKQVVTARYDGVFAFPVALAAMAAYVAWTTGRGWTGFWLANAVATLVKGPLGLVLSASGLLAIFWEYRSRNRVPLRGPQRVHLDVVVDCPQSQPAVLTPPRALQAREPIIPILPARPGKRPEGRVLSKMYGYALSNLPGILLYLGICGGWFAWSYAQLGHGLIDKMLGKELVNHAVQDGHHLPLQGFWEPIWNIFTNFLPWSIPMGVELWRVVKHPSEDVPQRRFERFLFCWVMVSVVLFSIAAHQRGRLVWPLMPALALLVGRQLDVWIKGMPTRKMFQIAGALTTVVLIFFGVYHHVLQARGRAVQKTLGMKAIANEIRSRVGENFPITYVGSPPFAIQFYLSTLHRNAKFPAAAEALRSDLPAFAVVEDYDRLLAQLGTNTTLHELYLWEGSDGAVRIVGNRPKLEPSESVEACLGPVRVRLEHARLDGVRDNVFTVTSLGKDALVTLQNVSTNGVVSGVRWPAQIQTRQLAPGESWRLTPP